MTKNSSLSPKIYHDEEQKPLEELISEAILLCERIREMTNINSSLSFKFQCLEVVKHVELLAQLLRSLVQFNKANSSTIYDRPIRRICLQVCRTLLRAHTLLKKCYRRRNLLRRIVNRVRNADFRKLFPFLEASAADLRWLVSVFRIDKNGGGCDDDEEDGDFVLGLPPIVSNDPILAWVWSYIATLQMGLSLSGRVRAAREVACLAKDSDRNKKMIVEEGGVSSLLRLLEVGSSREGQIAAAVALYNVANDGERVRVIVECMGVAVIGRVLVDSGIRVEIKLAELIGRMAEFDDGGIAKEEFGREGVVCTLVALLSSEILESELDWWSRTSRKELQRRKGRGNESAEVKEELKVCCSKALWMLTKGCVSNSIRIGETRGLRSLARLIEKESGVLQKNCVMVIEQITCAAESNCDLRKSAFKATSNAAKAVVDQLLRLITESSDTILHISAIRSIGCLSKTFTTRETRVIRVLVEQLSNSNHEIAAEAALALAKFADLENFLHEEHSNAVIEFGGLLPLMGLLRVRASEKSLVHGLVLLCHVCTSTTNTKALEQARVLNALDRADGSLIAEHPQLKELIAKAKYHIGLYHGIGDSLRQLSRHIYY